MVSRAFWKSCARNLKGGQVEICLVFFDESIDRRTPAEAVVGTFSGNEGDFRSGAASQLTHDALQIEIRGQWHRVDLEDPPASAGRGSFDLEVVIEASRTCDCIIQQFWSVGRRQHADIGIRFNAIHQGQKLIQEGSTISIAFATRTFGSNRVDFVKKMIDGARVPASSKMLRRRASDSPNHLV